MRKNNYLFAAIAAMVIGLGISTAARADTVIDLTTQDAIGEGNGALYIQTFSQPAGTGVLDPFVRIDVSGNNKPESGYNTDGRPVEFETKDENQWTHAIRVGDVQTVNYTYNGTTTLYRQFLLDINEPGNGKSLLSLYQVEIYLDSVGNNTDYAAGLGTKIYSLDTTATNSRVELDAAVNPPGSGVADMLLLVPDSLFHLSGVSNPYVYLYSAFGIPNGADAGFEEWGTSPGPNAQVVPLPQAAWLGIALVGGIVGARKLRSRRNAVIA